MQGVVKSYQHFNNRLVSVVCVSCETDFVARTQEFQDYVEKLLFEVAITECDNYNSFLSGDMVTESGTPKEIISKMNEEFGEKIRLETFLRYNLEDNSLKIWSPQ